MEYKQENKTRNNTYLIFLLIVVVFISVKCFNESKGSKDIKPLQFQQDIISHPGDIEKLVVVKRAEYVAVYLKKDSVSALRYNKYFKSNTNIPEKGPHFKIDIGSVDSFNSWMKDLQKELPNEMKVNIEYDNSKDVFIDVFAWILPTILLIPYFIPTVVAYVRKKRNATAILILNIFLGWTIIGWVIALVWSVKKDAEK